MKKHVIQFILILIYLSGCATNVEAKAILRMSLDEIYQDKQVRALARAAGKGKIKTIDRLLDKGVNINSIGARGVPILFWSMRQGNISGFRYLLEKGADPNIQWEGKSSVMYRVAGMKDSRFLEAALKYNGNPNLIGSSQTTPIYFSATNGLILNLKLLVKAGADINHKDSIGNPPIVDAVSLSEFKTAYSMLELGASFDFKNKFNVSLEYYVNGKMHLDLGKEENMWRKKVIQYIKESQKRQ